ncbi:ankyrin repeat domain-containing protein 36C-like, partial [Daubentonia madagascariensis]
LSSTLDCD